MNDMQRYAKMRGVVIVPEIRMPSHVYSWRHADPKLIADCPVLAAKNPNNVLLNPFNSQVYDYIKGIV